MRVFSALRHFQNSTTSYDLTNAWSNQVNADKVENARRERGGEVALKSLTVLTTDEHEENTTKVMHEQFFFIQSLCRVR